MADANAAVNAGADAIGLVFYKASKRNISAAQGCEIVNSLPAFVTVVGLFVNASAQEIRTTHAAVGFDLVQYHGEEDSLFCRNVGLPYIKAVRVENSSSIASAMSQFAQAKAILADTYVKHQQGGTGQVFDWQLLPAASAGRIILAGGLNPENIKLAIQQASPYAVDVSTGVELSPGVKDPVKIRKFIEGVKHADKNRQTAQRGQ